MCIQSSFTCRVGVAYGVPVARLGKVAQGHDDLAVGLVECELREDDEVQGLAVGFEEVGVPDFQA